MRARRASSGAFVATPITPAATTSTPPPAPRIRTPYPVSTRPGSMPRTRRIARSGPGNRSRGRDRLDDLVRNVKVGVDVLDVVQLLERLHEAQDCGRFLALHADRRLGHERDLASQHGDRLGFERAPDDFHFTRGGGDFESFFDLLDVGGAGVQ